MKIAKRIVTLVLVAAVMLVMTACGDTEKFVGTWSSEMDFKEPLLAQIQGQTDAEGAEFMQYFSIDSFPMTMIFEFNEDKTFSVYADPQSVQAAMDALKPAFSAAIYPYLEDMLAASAAQYGYTLEEFMELAGAADLDALVEMSMGYGVDQFIDSAFEEMDIGTIAGDMTSTGTYEADGGKLTLTMDGEASVERYELSGDTFTLLGAQDDAENAALAELASLYPVTFKKVA